MQQPCRQGSLDDFQHACCDHFSKHASQACVAAGHDTSALNIIVPAEPVAQACDAGVAPAGCV